MMMGGDFTILVHLYNFKLNNSLSKHSISQTNQLFIQNTAGGESSISPAASRRDVFIVCRVAQSIIRISLIQRLWKQLRPSTSKGWMDGLWLAHCLHINAPLQDYFSCLWHQHTAFPRITLTRSEKMLYITAQRDARFTLTTTAQDYE